MCYIKINLYYIMDTKYLFIILLIICWTLNPFLKKYSASKLSSSDYMIFNHILCTFIVFIYFMYLLINKQCDINCIQKLNNTDIMFSIFGAITSVFGSVLLIELLKKNGAIDIIPNIQPLVLILTLVIGKFIFNENLTNTKMLGIITIVGGLYLINK